MSSMFFYITKEDCQEMSSSQIENGLLEIVMPKNYDDIEFLNYIKDLSKVEYNKILDKQEKVKKVFRENIKKLINKYKKEFKLPFTIRL